MRKISCIVPLSRVCNVLLREGLLPSRVLKKTAITKLILHSIFYTFILFCLVMDGVKSFKTGNTIAFNHVTCMFIPVVNLLIKAITILRKKDIFISLLDDLKSDVFNNHSKKLNRYIQFVYKVSELILKYYIMVISAYLFISAALPFVIDIRMIIPTPFEMGKYDVIYKAMHVVMCVYLGLNSTSFDVLYMTLLGICIAQLYILEEMLMHVYEEAREVCRSDDPNEVCLKEEETLKRCILLHEALARYVDKLCTILSFPLFIQYTCGCFIICNAILLVTVMGETNTGNIISVFVYAGITFSEMAVYHWFGNEIIFKSTNITDACYLSQWYNLNIKTKKSLMLLMERAKRPLVVQLYKFVFISLESLGVIVRWSYSLFALIKARYS